MPKCASEKTRSFRVYRAHIIARVDICFPNFMNRGKFVENQSINLRFCRCGGVPFYVIEGKVRIEATLVADEEPKKDYTNRWVAVVIKDEWRLVDVMFAARGKFTGPGNWELVDNNGQVWIPSNTSFLLPFFIANILVSHTC